MEGNVLIILFAVCCKMVTIFKNITPLLLIIFWIKALRLSNKLLNKYLDKQTD